MKQYRFIFHLRKPGADIAQYSFFLERLPAKHHSRIVIHGAYCLADTYKLGGIHFPSKKRKDALAIPVKGTKSTSCHSLRELSGLDASFDYAFISPVFDSISKSGYKSNISRKDLSDYLDNENRKEVIALGGIDGDRIIALQEMKKLDGVAVLGAVWGDQPENRKQVCKNLKQLISCMG